MLKQHSVFSIILKKHFCCELLLAVYQIESKLQLLDNTQVAEKNKIL